MQNQLTGAVRKNKQQYEYITKEIVDLIKERKKAWQLLKQFPNRKSQNN